VKRIESRFSLILALAAKKLLDQPNCSSRRQQGWPDKGDDEGEAEVYGSFYFRRNVQAWQIVEGARRGCLGAISSSDDVGTAPQLCRSAAVPALKRAEGVACAGSPIALTSGIFCQRGKVVGHLAERVTKRGDVGNIPLIGRNNLRKLMFVWTCHWGSSFLAT